MAATAKGIYVDNAIVVDDDYEEKVITSAGNYDAGSANPSKTEEAEEESLFEKFRKKFQKETEEPAAEFTLESAKEYLGMDVINEDNINAKFKEIYGDPTSEAALKTIFMAEHLTERYEDDLLSLNQNMANILRSSGFDNVDDAADYVFRNNDGSSRYRFLNIEEPVELVRPVEYDLAAMEEAFRIKYAEELDKKNAANDPAAASRLVNLQKEAVIANEGSLLQSGAAPRNYLAKKSLYDQDSASVLADGILWAGTAKPKRAGVIASAAGAPPKPINEQVRDYYGAKTSNNQQGYLDNLKDNTGLTGRYAGWTDDQKFAAQNYISDALGGYDLSDALIEMHAAGLSDEEIHAFQAEMSEALNSADFTEEAMDSWFEPAPEPDAEPESEPETEAESAEEPVPEMVVVDNRSEEMIAGDRIVTMERVHTAINNGDWETAAELQYGLLVDMVNRSDDSYVKELVQSEGGQKAAIALMQMVQKSGLPTRLDDSDIRAQLRVYESYILEALDIEQEPLTEFVQFLDNALNMGGKLVEAQENDGLGLTLTLQWALDNTAYRVTDMANKFLGAGVIGAGRLSGNENWVKAGERLSGEQESNLAGMNQILMEKGTPLEIIGGQAGSETAKMYTLGAASQWIHRGNMVHFGEKLKWLQRALTSAPFSAESGIQEFHKTYQESQGDASMSFMTSLGAFSASTLANQFDGVLPNIEAAGMPYISEVVDKLNAIPGTGVKATIKRWGKAGELLLWNMLKTSVNEGVQEGAENILTTAVTDAIKGESIFDRDWNEYGKEVRADAMMGAIMSVGSSVSVMPAYSRSVQVAESLMGKSGVTMDDVNTLVDTLAEDMNDPVMAEEARERASAVAIETRTDELIASGAVDNSKAAAADEQRIAKQERFEAARREEQRTKNAMRTAYERMKQETSTPNTNAAVEAVRVHEAAAVSMREAEKELAKALQKYEAESAAVRAEAEEMARQEVGEQLLARQQERQQRDIAREQQRQNANADTLDVDDFISNDLTQAGWEPTEEERQKVSRLMQERRNARAASRAQNTEAPSEPDSNHRFVRAVEKKFGVKVTVTDTSKGGTVLRYNGAYDPRTDSIVIDSNATQSDLIYGTLLHELTHKAERSETYQEFASAILSLKYGGDDTRLAADIRAKQESYNRGLKAMAQLDESVDATELTADDASREIVADLTREILYGDEASINQLVAEQPSVARRVLDTIKNFIQKLTGVRDPAIDQLNRARELFEKALGASDASENSYGGMQFQLIPYTDHQKNNWAASNSIEVYNGDPAQIIDFVNRVRADRGLRKKLYMGQVDAKLADAIRTATGVETEGMNLTLHSDEVAKIFSDHGIERKEADRGQRAINAEDFVRLIDVVSEPDEIRLSDKDRFGKPVVEFVKEVDGKRTVVTYTSTKHNDLRVQTMYIGAKKRSLATPMDEQASINTPEASSGTAPDVILPESDPAVNRLGEENRERIQYSLPSDMVLVEMIDRYLARQEQGGSIAPPNMAVGQPGQQEQPRMGKRQFANQTLQDSPAMPDWLKQEMRSNPTESDYEIDSNYAQAERGWNRIQENGYEQERDRLLQLERFSADDTAEANLIMAMAEREGDAETLLAVASKYNREGTKAGQELQARKLFTRMSPTAAKVMVAGQLESRLQDELRERRPLQRRMDEHAQRVADRLNALPEPEEASSENRWRVTLNQQQLELIREYGLQHTRRPGIYYNRATTEQRMLEAIIATPNPLAATGNGLNLVQRLEYMNSGLAVVTNADLNYIGTQLGQFIGLGGEVGSRDADVAVARAYEAFGNITPVGIRQKMRTWRYMSMLGTLTSPERNIIGNIAQSVPNAVSHGLAANVVDPIVSLFTGQRTTASLDVRERVEGWRAFVQETKDTFKDFFVDRVEVQNRLDDKFNTNRSGRVYQSPVLEAARNLEGFLMSVGDRNFWKKAYVNSIAEQQKLQDRGLLRNEDGTTPTQEQILERAEADANYATFNEDNRVRDVVTALKQVPGLGDAIDFIMPFTGVPTNIISRMWQYSPFGVITTAGNVLVRAVSGRNFDQRALVNGLSRNLTGTALFGVGMFLQAAGIIRLGTGDEEDDKKYGVRTAQGEQYTPYIYNPFNGEYVGLAAFAPAISPLIMGATAQDILKDEPDKVVALQNAAFSGMDQIFDASYMTGLADVFGGYGNPTENIATSLFSSAVSQNVPALLGQLADAMDPYVRDTKDKNLIMEALKSGLINNIPGLRESLPKKIDVTGQPVMQGKEGVENFFNPFTVTDARNDAVLNEMMRVSESVGNSTMLPSDALSGRKNSFQGLTFTVDTQTKEAYKQRYGDLWYNGGTYVDGNGNKVKVQGVADLIESSAYAKMSDTEKAKAIEKTLSLASSVAKAEAADAVGADSEKLWKTVTTNKKGEIKNTARLQVEAGQYGSLATFVSDLKKAGSSNQTIKSSVTELMKPIYQELNRKGETEKMKEIRRILYQTGLYDKYNFEQHWLK